MKNIITEDIIRNALNESIDEFIIEEEFGEGLKSWRNQPYMQTARNYVGKVYNGLKNAAAMYMDARTNGRWNQKYNINPNFGTANSESVVGQWKEMYVLSNWLKFHAQRLYNILFNKDVETYNRWKNDWTPEEYIHKNITSNYFQAYARKFFHGFMLAENHPISKYINRINENYNNPQEAYNLLSISSFYKSDEYRLEYSKMVKSFSQKQQQAQQQTQQQSQQQNNQPVPDANGHFHYNPKAIDWAIGPYSGWKPSKDANKRDILVNPQDTTKAVFI